MSSKGSAKQQVNSKAKVVNKEPPAKKDKRTHSEVSNDSQNTSSVLDMSGLQAHLDNISSDIGDLKGVLESMLKKEEIETLIQKTMTKIMEGMESKMKEEIELRVNEKTKNLKERIQVLEYDNRQLTDRIERSESETKRSISDLVEKEKLNEGRSRDALKRANHNEQYSRKNNVKIAGLAQERDETQITLNQKVMNLLQENEINQEKSDIIAMHRIPAKRGDIKPVIIKTVNNNAKAKIMRKRKDMKAKGYRLIDDVTALNTGLINRLQNHDDISSAWFFNGYVYGQTVREERIRFDIFDNVSEVVASYRSKRR